MTGTIVITGASSGIGASAARSLAAAGWHVAVVGRNAERTRAIADEIGGRAFLADFDRLEEVRELAASLASAYPTIDVLANNAGGLISKRAWTVDRHERTNQLNHLAPFLLTRLLMPTLIASGARVIGTSSAANMFGSLRVDDLDWAKRAWFGGWPAYGASKVATIVFTRELAKRGIEAYSFHPGFVSTEFGGGSTMMKLSRMANLGISPEQGAAPIVHLASASDVGVPSGSYFDGLKPSTQINPSADKPGIGESLWAASSRMVGLEP